MQPRIASIRLGARVQDLTPSWKVGALFVVLVLAFALGIWGSYRAVFPEKGVHRLTAVFQSRVGETAILVGHEAIPAVGMGSM